MKTISFAANNPEEIKIKLDKQIGEGFSPTLAFVFASIKPGIHKTSQAFKAYPFPVFGCSTGGNILSDHSENCIYEEGAVVTLVELNEKYFSYRIIERGSLSSFDLGRDIGLWGASEFKDPAFILVASGLSLDGKELVEGALDAAGDDTIMFGGLAGDDTRFEQPFVFSGKMVLDSGAISIALDREHIDIKGLATSGWVGLGKDLRVTSATSNIVYSIDDEPALEVYKKYLDVKDADLPAIGVEYPLLIKHNDTYSLRAVMGVDRKNKALIFAGTVPQDAIVTFSSSPGFEVIDSTKEKINEFYEKYQDADMLLLFSCMARYLALGPVITEEIKFSAEKWGIPVSGFFTYGEIGTNMGSICDFYNQTYTLVSLKEK
ncbi:MAG: FIST C-terminal domain-containing protein [Bacteroidetes bacterium]|nr:FIST C-terminal domain-containing protein [Bacteroidota bacterium]